MNPILEGLLKFCSTNNLFPFIIIFTTLFPYGNLLSRISQPLVTY